MPSAGVAAIIASACAGPRRAARTLPRPGCPWLGAHGRRRPTRMAAAAR